MSNSLEALPPQMLSHRAGGAWERGRTAAQVPGVDDRVNRPTGRKNPGWPTNPPPLDDGEYNLSVDEHSAEGHGSTVVSADPLFPPLSRAARGPKSTCTENKFPRDSLTEPALPSPRRASVASKAPSFHVQKHSRTPRPRRSNRNRPRYPRPSRRCCRSGISDPDDAVSRHYRRSRGVLH